MTTTKPESEELKACPFCGNPPDLEEQNGYLIIDCQNEDCLGPSVSSKEHLQLIARWNRRDDARLRLLEALEDDARKFCDYWAKDVSKTGGMLLSLFKIDAFDKGEDK